MISFIDDHSAAHGIKPNSLRQTRSGSDVRQCALRRQAFSRGIVATCRGVHHPAHGRNRICLSQFVNQTVSHRGSFVKYVANFFVRLRSSFTPASPLRVLDRSRSRSIGRRCPLPMSASCSLRETHNQLSGLLFDMDSCFAARP